MRSKKINSNWLPSSINNGWKYETILKPCQHGTTLIELLSREYKHSSKKDWESRIIKGEVRLNNTEVVANQILHKGDVFTWNRSPWLEPAIPINWQILFDNGDLVVIDKPAGLPVCPRGGFIKHTLVEQLKSISEDSKPNNYPKPVHRLGRFTSGILICAREKKTRKNLSAQFRQKQNPLNRIYLALAKPNINLLKDQTIKIETPISKQFHPYLTYLWNINMHPENQSKEFEALTEVSLIERRKNLDLLKIQISTGRPHQIRIHLASIGTPLIGDPLYKENGEINQYILPGEGGYYLHAHKISKIKFLNKIYSFKSKTPKIFTTDQ